jgi:hypothetical protein
LANVVGQGEVSARVRVIDEVVRDPLTLGGGGLGRRRIETAIDLQSVAADDLSTDAFGQRDGDARLARTRGPQDDEQPQLVPP